MAADDSGVVNDLSFEMQVQIAILMKRDAQQKCDE